MLRLNNIHQRLSLPHLFDDIVLALKLHHLQRGQRRLRHLGVKEAQRIQLFGQFVLGHAAERISLLRLDLDIKNRLAVELLPVRQAHTLRAQSAIVILDILRRAASSFDAEAAPLVIELPNQLDQQMIDLDKGAVRALEHIARELIARLLQSRDRCRRGDAGVTAALVKIAVAAGLLELLNLVLQVVDDIAVQRVDGYLLDIVLVQRDRHIDERLPPVGILLAGNAGIIADKPTRRAG